MSFYIGDTVEFSGLTGQLTNCTHGGVYDGQHCFKGTGRYDEYHVLPYQIKMVREGPGHDAKSPYRKDVDWSKVSPPRA